MNDKPFQRHTNSDELLYWSSCCSGGNVRMMTDLDKTSTTTSQCMKRLTGPGEQLSLPIHHSG